MQKLTKTGKLERFDWERAESSENMADASKHLVHVSDFLTCLLYTSPSPRDLSTSRMPSSA